MNGEIEMIQRFVDYSPETGLMTWNPRQPSDFEGVDAAKACRSWNLRYAGKPAFAVPTKQGYLTSTINGKNYLAHRVVWLLHHGAWPEVVDHINAVKTDNRIGNLRSVDKSGNARNTARPKHNTSGVLGVSYDKARDKWEAHVTVYQKKIFLGRFAEFDDAVAARKDANAKYGFSETHGRAA